MKLINRGKLQNFLADLRIFINREQSTSIEEEKVDDSCLSQRLFIGAFHLLRRKGIRCPFYPYKNILKQSWCFWWTPRYKIGMDFIFELSLLTTKYKNIPIKIENLPKGIENQKNFKIILSLIGETETFDEEKKIILTRKSTYTYKRSDGKLLKIFLNKDQKKGLLLILSFIRDHIKTFDSLLKSIIEKQRLDEINKVII